MKEAIQPLCPYCLTPIAHGRMGDCPSVCKRAHHEECWRDNGGCTTFGCPANPEPRGYNGAPREGFTSLPLANIRELRPAGEHVASSSSVSRSSRDGGLRTGLAIGTIVTALVLTLFFVGMSALGTFTPRNQASLEARAPSPTEQPVQTSVPAETQSAPTTLIPTDAASGVRATVAILVVRETSTPEVGSTPALENLTSRATASASSVLPPLQTKRWGLVHYDPSYALDSDPTTSWVEGVNGPGIGEQLTLTFPRPITVMRLGVDVGFDRDEAIFYQNHRVRRARLIFSDGSMQRADFLDKRGTQYVPVDSKITTSIVIMIDDVYRGSKYDDTPIAEVEVWGYEGR